MSGKKLLVVAVATVLIALGIVSWTDRGSVEADTDEVTAMMNPGGGFIKFEGIDGEATEMGHVGWSELKGFSQGVSSDAPSEHSRRRAEAVVGDIEITKEMDKASPKIAEACCDGRNFDDVTIHLMSDRGDLGQEVYYEYELEDVIVVGYHIGSEDVEKVVPEETITLKVSRLTVIYTEYDDMGNPKGEVMYSWDVEKGSEK